MAYQIIWTAHADNDFHSIIIYLKENWSDLAAEKFVNKTMRKLERIANMPYVPRLTTQSNVYMIQLDRKNVLFFMLENEAMILLSIYPYKKDITRSPYF